MKIFSVPLALLAIALAAPAAADGGAAQDPSAAAKELVREGTSQYSVRNWEAARAAFAKAWALRPHYAIAGSLADVEMKLGHYRDAADHLKYALANLPADHPEKRADAEASLKECRAHLSAVRVSVNVPGATVSLDAGELAPEVLADDILLDPGAHKIEARKAGYLTSSRDFTASAGEAREIQLDLARPPSPALASGSTSRASFTPSSAKVSDGDAPAHSSARTWVLIGGGTATVVAAGLGTYFLVRGSSLASDSDRLAAQVTQQGAPERAGTNTECAPDAPMRPTAACEALSRNSADRDTASTNAAISWIAAGALGAATITTYLLWPVEDDVSPAKTARVSVTPWLVGARGGAVQVSF
ncbi:MAG: hypothetical protein ABI548_29140 [Polyangiaceae bacterium]